MLKKIAIVLITLLLFGIARTPFEIGFFKELKTAKLISPELDPESRQNIGLVSYAAVLGGLRAPVASMLNLEAFTHFENLNWESVEETYKTITSLQPYNTYYWETAGWHLAYNAYADYNDRVGIKDSYRRLRQRRYLEKGSQFFAAGSRLNPHNAKLHRENAFLWSNHMRQPNFARSAKLYEKTLQIPGAQGQYEREYIYTLARVPGREGEAFDRLKALNKKSNQLVYPTTRCLYFVLQEKLNLPSFEKKHLLDIFKSRQQALGELSNYYLRTSLVKLPKDGVRSAIQKLELELGTPAEKSILRAKRPIPMPYQKRR